MLARLRQYLKETATHVLHAFLQPKQLGSLFPSSPFIASGIQKRLPAKPMLIVEYGPGTGNITRALLRKLSFNGKLIAIELNPKFEKMLDQMGDPRLQVRLGGVLEVLPSIAHDQKVDAVVSGIPFSFFPEEDRETIVIKTRQLLRPGGSFIVYQSTRLLVPLFEKHFDSISVKYEPRNIFPYFIISGTVKEP